MFKRILLPTDGSELCLHGVRLGVELARSCGASVCALHVIPPFHTFTYMAEMIEATETTYMEGAVQRAERHLADVRELATKAGVPYEGSHVVGDTPSESIVREAQQRQCDLIVMASHGWRGLSRLLLGSETHKVLLTSSVPVLVCH
ncbi:universal stress protein [Rhodanobacter lindaniclasticus]|jgi:nucleotide-binding universal stress UspA family protein|uniref:Universal stress protein n=1 Tax=Rhodanobacter lindaniclasticus TaxID=75310 RepID=A0A4S3KFB8_9GAMM|nr:universal stress protein [Rhodanobacter lindaniclasticus]THD07159.1 universal stress protein UspA [Rhodanobacter lindaniclasticus]